ncbi:hypothetical protein VP1G_11083 [Cytospora mali]|uniref:Uncharacterized protein n=1 Tax=Cytospora mali TaxID=578113 RepID=A0A194V3S3_CYTMA|nr:hypothetical protein VP1G_11083 [Valsa mali var. pyri (nom. inval.)]
MKALEGLPLKLKREEEHGGRGYSTSGHEFLYASGSTRLELRWDLQGQPCDDEEHLQLIVDVKTWLGNPAVSIPQVKSPAPITEPIQVLNHTQGTSAIAVSAHFPLSQRRNISQTGYEEPNGRNGTSFVQ